MLLIYSLWPCSAGRSSWSPAACPECCSCFPLVVFSALWAVTIWWWVLKWHILLELADTKLWFDPSAVPCPELKPWVCQWWPALSSILPDDQWSVFFPYRLLPCNLFPALRCIHTLFVPFVYCNGWSPCAFVWTQGHESDTSQTNVLAFFCVNFYPFGLSSPSFPQVVSVWLITVVLVAGECQDWGFWPVVISIRTVDIFFYLR